MKWPWQRHTRDGSLIVGTADDGVAWVYRAQADAPLRCGLELRGDDPPSEFARRLRALDLPTRGVTAVLPLQASQLLQIDAPGVRPEELRAATRWRIKDLVDGPVDALTLDVMPVGDASERESPQLFVALARNEIISHTTAQALAAGWQLSVIEIAETVQRNLQSAAADAAGQTGRATAGLVLHGSTYLLTFCAGNELFMARRIDGSGFDATAAARPQAALTASALDADFVDYGAEDLAVSAAQDTDAPRLIIELQRSFDVWERSAPDRPLACLWVDAGDASGVLIKTLRHYLGLPVERLDPATLFPGLQLADLAPGVARAVMPLLGGLLRAERRAL